VELIIDFMAQIGCTWLSNDIPSRPYYYIIKAYINYMS